MNEWIESNSSFKARIIGKLLGDGSITKQKERKPRFQFTHTYTDFGWTQHCYTLLKGHIPINPPKFKITIDKRLKKGYSQAYIVQSRTSPIITFLRSKWYISGKKIIPIDLLEKYFDEESLAWWYMDDGHLKIKNNKPQKIILSTDSFSRFENKWLIEFLETKFNLTFSLDKQNRIILYDQMQIYYFLHLITPYLHESMYRKVLEKCNSLIHLPARRTTLYLPNFLLLQAPTKDLNQMLGNLTKLIDDYKYGNFYKVWYPEVFSYDCKKTQGYQIVINLSNTTKLQFLQDNTGLSYSQLAYLCIYKKIEKQLNTSR